MSETTFQNERPEHAAAVERLIDEAFGPGRFVKTAERLREGSTPLRHLSIVALSDGEVVGCSRLWPVKIGQRPAVLLGPFAVAGARRSEGLGAALIERCCLAAREAGEELVLLVGDAPYFGKLGFAPAPDVVLPGPVDRRRVLVRALKGGAADGLAGAVTRRPI